MTEPNRTDTHPATEIDMTVDSSGAVDQAEVADQAALEEGLKSFEPVSPPADELAEPIGPSSPELEFLGRDAPPGSAFAKGGKFDQESIDEAAQADKVARDKEARDAELQAREAEPTGFPAFATGGAFDQEAIDEAAALDKGLEATKAPLLSEQELDEMLAKTPAQREVRPPNAVDPAPHSPSEQLFERLREQKEKVPETADAGPLTYEKLLPPPRKFQVTPEGLEDPKERLRRLERVEIPTLPERQAHPPHGRQEHAPHGTLPLPLPAVVAIGLMLVALTVFALTRGGGTAATPAPTEGRTVADAPGAAASAAPSAPRTPAPVGATLTVVPVYRFPVSEDCPAVPGSQQEITSSGQAHVVRLEPKVVTNPAAGVSARYDWGMFTLPGRRCSWSLGLEYEGASNAGTAFVLFPPSTTYSYVQTQPTSAPGGGRQIATILTVTNGSPR